MKVFKFLRYLIETIIIIFFFFIFKIIGLKKSSFISGKIFIVFGKFFRSQKKIENNLKIAFPNLTNIEIKQHISEMWNYYGKVFAEYIFLNDLRKNQKGNIQINGTDILNKLKENNESVIFVSGHFDNFELMAMYLEKSGIKLSAVYRPLNNFFMNLIMERFRKKYICKNQIKKGIGGLKNLINLKKKNFSTALMIDQRVTEGILSNFFNEKALTTTIPAQLIKKFNIPIVPVYIERIKDINFKIVVNRPIEFSKDSSIQTITDELNRILEVMILKNPDQWIWSHNRWK